MRKQPAIIFHKKHTSEDEKDGNGDMIQNKLNFPRASQHPIDFTCLDHR